EIILGMDWMSFHYVMLDCDRKLVTLPEPGVVKYLSANQLTVAQKNGTFEFLMLARAEVTTKNKIEDVPVMQDFKDVFPIKITGLPPIRDIEFFIDLQPGTGP
ncbi:hypothetical protein A2U01_0055343, partial [Trifolium medium]|nr:hypothetical protein [Trifolium medium]